MKLLRKFVRNNRIAIIAGALVGVIGTRFMEDGNLLVSSVLVLLTSSIALALWLLSKWLFKI
ncbi:unannotated protein [freshwater metagenome]|uniref:Unannotated protein n=1 Tax=freshwater metagenome TaxID=449393 RepID=A0A6J6NYM0_9ZZZZ